MDILVALILSALAAPAALESPPPGAREPASMALALRLDELAAPRRNRAPVADAGPDLDVGEGKGVELFGAASFDPDGDALAFEWLQVSGPAVVLEPGPRVANPAFAAPSGGERALVFELRVSDGRGQRGMDRVVVTVWRGIVPERESSEPLRGEVSVARRRERSDRPGDVRF